MNPLPSNRERMMDEASRIVERNLHLQEQREYKLKLANKIIEFSENVDSEMAVAFWRIFVEHTREV